MNVSKSSLNRRDFLKVGGMSTVALTLGTTGLLSLTGTPTSLAASGNSVNRSSGFAGYGPLVKDPNGILDLPRGFQYRIISKTGDKMSNGDLSPALPDGMAAFKGEKNTTILVRNHEKWYKLSISC